MRELRRGALLALFAVLICLPLMGCELRQLVVEIPDFDSSAVEGVEVWRIDDVSGEAVSDGEVRFDGVFDHHGIEMVGYTLIKPEGVEGLSLAAPLLRQPGSDQVRLELYWSRTGEEGWFRVSTFNSLGSSPLSLEQTYL